MKVYQINTFDLEGGAARAAYRIHGAVHHYGIDSTMCVNLAKAGDWTVKGPATKLAQGLALLRSPVGGVFSKLLKTEDYGFHSPALLPSNWPKKLNSSDAELVHMHWVNAEMMSIEDIAKITNPIVWTLHDMWAFCGAEHYTEELRWLNGYTKSNRPSYESGFDLSRWVWQRKLKAWNHPIHIVTPSHWLADCVKQSVIMRDWPVTVIENAIDTDVWQPVAKNLARQLLGLPQDIPLLLFGAIGGGKDPRKGFDLLREALVHLRGQIDGLQLVVFGQMEPKEPEDFGFPVNYMGHLHDNLTLQLLYNSADILAIPSRQDNLPNTGVESLSCGTPVVAFDTCGLKDVVNHEKTGYLAKPFDTEDLASGIQWVLADKDRYKTLSASARQDAVERFSYPVVAQKYSQVYNSAIKFNDR